MKEAMQSLIKKFKAIGVTGSAMVTELLRFRVLDQILQTSPEVRQWGITGDKLYELAQQSTVEVFGELPYDQVAFESVYGPSFAVEVMDFITETGYVKALRPVNSGACLLKTSLNSTRIRKVLSSLPILKNMPPWQKKFCKPFHRSVYYYIHHPKHAIIYLNNSIRWLRLLMNGRKMLFLTIL